MKRFKKLLVLILTAAMLCGVISVSGFAAEPVPVADEDAQEAQLIATIYISADECKEIYYSMTGYSSWSLSIASTVVGEMNIAAGLITTVVSAIQNLNYNTAKTSFYNGWKSGNGCKMLVYDNAVPTILAL